MSDAVVGRKRLQKLHVDGEEDQETDESAGKNVDAGAERSAAQRHPDDHGSEGHDVVSAS